MAAVRTRSNRAGRNTSLAVVNDAAAKIKRPVGHPPCYTPEIAAEICRRLSAGEYLKDICKDDGMPSHPTVHTWVVEDMNGFFSSYIRARRAAVLSDVEKCREIADNSDAETVRCAELRIKTRQWVAERVYQSVFGQKLTVDEGPPALNPEQVRERYEARQRELRELEGGGK